MLCHKPPAQLIGATRVGHAWLHTAQTGAVVRTNTRAQKVAKREDVLLSKYIGKEVIIIKY